ncbi:surfeit locus protein 2-like [Thalassophryne amazonica]|uniref:surfeit locus protein 2-like n=1 Tax=Thalassophryne amazonica TaxID=390379 RepID=UPI0014718B54|nr:surfeit locus protein 2-like [Thalassophryne amazonica]
MEDLPAVVKGFLLNHPYLELTDSKKIKCTLNGHEIPCKLDELQKFTQGKKYKKLRAEADFNYSQYEPHVVASTKQPNRFFCKLTVKHLNRDPQDVLKHVNGKRYKKALSKYEECVQQGIEFVPARLQQKKPKEDGEDVEQRKATKHRNMWMPSSSDEDDDHSDSEDSMSDLYPPSMFTLKTSKESNVVDEKEEKDFQTDEDEEMEVDQQVMPKRKKVQGGQHKKKFRNSHWKSSHPKKHGKAQNGK